MKKYALLIGVEEYEDRGITPVRFARADVLALAERLRRFCGFDVVHTLSDTSGRDAPRLINVLRVLRDLAGDLRAGDFLLLYFGGHGVEINGQGYLLTADTLGAFPEHGSLSLSTLQQTFSRLAASKRLLLLDACRWDPHAGKGDADASLGQGFCRDVLAVAQAQSRAEDAPEVTTALLSACSSGQRAWEWEAKGHGVFTHYVLEGIDGAAWRGDELEFEDLGRYVKTEVKRWCSAALHIPQAQDCWGEKFGLDRLVLAVRSEHLAPTPEERRPTDLESMLGGVEKLQKRELAEMLDELEQKKKMKEGRKGRDA